MIFRTPDYYSKFRCIADNCRDSCCIGWEIDIDRETAALYDSVQGNFGERLKNSISDGSFVLTEDERCPFLNKSGLCDIYTELGEESLCQICSDHPRYYEWFGHVKEGGIGLCCEEAARIILLNDHSIYECEVPDESCDDYDPELFGQLCSARDEIIYHLQHDDFTKSVCTMLDYAEELQVLIDSEDISLPQWTEKTKAEQSDEKPVLSFFTQLEPIDEAWIPYIKGCISMTDTEPLPVSFEPYLRRIAVYFIYRYFLKGVFDCEILSRVKLAAVSVWTIGHLWKCGLKENASLCLEDCAWTAKNFSKEVEYSEENLEALADAFYDNDIFSIPKIKGLFSQLT